MSGESRPDWLPATAGEDLRYVGRPRIKAAIPAAIVGIAFVAVGVVGLIAPDPLPRSAPIVGGALAAIALGVAIPAWSVLRLRHTQYVVTERALYTKRGILGRSVTSVGFETIQNVTTSQSVTGRLFDHGSIAVETAGGGRSAVESESQAATSGPELAFKHVNDPRSIQRLIDTGPSATGGSTRSIPGSTAQWRAICEEIRGWRRALD